MVRWNHVTFTTTHNLRLELKALGFIENGPWKWQPAQQWDTLFDNEDQKTLDLTEGTTQTLGLQLHLIRKMFKIKCFVAFYHQKQRHDSAELRECGDLHQINIADVQIHRHDRKPCSLGR